MKKTLVSGLVVLSILTVGCSSDKVVLEKNVEKSQSTKDYDISETKLDITLGSFPLEVKYSNEGVLLLDSFQEPVSKYGVINEKGELKEKKLTQNFAGGYLNFETFNFKEFIQISQYYGRNEEGSNKEFYYRDNLNNVTFKVDGFKDFVNNYLVNYPNKYSAGGKKLANNENYFIFNINTVDLDENANHAIYDEEKYMILDIENQKAYYQEVPTKKGEDGIAGVYFDKSLDSIMAITYSGKVKKVNLKDNKIQLEEYKTLNLQGYKIIEAKVDIETINDSKVTFPITDNTNVEDPFYTAIYNTETGEVKVLEKDTRIQHALGKNNLATISYKGEMYLGEIKEDNSVEYIYDFGTSEKGDIYARVTINDEGNRLFVIKEKSNKNNIEREAYFIDLKKK